MINRILYWFLSGIHMLSFWICGIGLVLLVNHMWANKPALQMDTLIAIPTAVGFVMGIIALGFFAILCFLIAMVPLWRIK